MTDHTSPFRARLMKLGLAHIPGKPFSGPIGPKRKLSERVFRLRSAIYNDRMWVLVASALAFLPIMVMMTLHVGRTPGLDAAYMELIRLDPTWSMMIILLVFVAATWFVGMCLHILFWGPIFGLVALTVRCAEFLAYRNRVAPTGTPTMLAGA